MDKAGNTSTEKWRGWTRQTNWKSAEDFQKQFVVTAYWSPWLKFSIGPRNPTLHTCRCFGMFENGELIKVKWLFGPGKKIITWKQIDTKKVEWLSSRGGPLKKKCSACKTQWFSWIMINCHACNYRKHRMPGFYACQWGLLLIDDGGH